MNLHVFVRKPMSVRKLKNDMNNINIQISTIFRSAKARVFIQEMCRTSPHSTDIAQRMKYFSKILNFLQSIRLYNFPGEWIDTLFGYVHMKLLMNHNFLLKDIHASMCNRENLVTVGFLQQLPI